MAKCFMPNLLSDSCSIDRNAIDTFKAPEGSKDTVKIVHMTINKHNFMKQRKKKL